MKENSAGSFLFSVFVVVYTLILIPFALVSFVLYALGAPKKKLGNFWYNEDRTIASGLWGVSQETISSEVGRIAIGAGQPNGWTPKSKFQVKWAKALAKWLNSTPAIWGRDHTAKAIIHANQLDQADDGVEK